MLLTLFSQGWADIMRIRQEHIFAVHSFKTEIEFVNI